MTPKFEFGDVIERNGFSISMTGVYLCEKPKEGGGFWVMLLTYQGMKAEPGRLWSGRSIYWEKVTTWPTTTS